MNPTGERATSTAGLGVRERASILMRSFFIQSVWNPKGMQNVGFCFALLPVLRRVAADRDAVREFLERHLSFFNTNPALSTYALSAAAAAEVAGDPKGASEFKRALSSPLGMAGDSLLWGGVRPAAALLAVSAALVGARWAPAVLLTLYNVPHLFLRVRGVNVGARQGPRGARELSSARFRGLVTAARGVTCFAAGLAAALAIGFDGAVSPQGLATAGGFFVLTFVALRVRVPVAAIGLAGVVGGVAIMLSRV
ncbi:MAG: PTS system mannose/fructose/sorbose family transporter subunit IID [Candidatus Eisenbacteria bacterium]